MGEKILVVDDEVVVTSFLSDYLTGEGYEVILASNGEDALKLAEQEKPHLILLDIRMPGIDGIEACKRLKAEEETRFIPVIMMTGFPYEKVDAIEVGADEFINKPLDPRELAFRLKCISRIRYLTEELDKAVSEIEGLQEYSYEREAEPTEVLKHSGIATDKVLVADDEAHVRDFLKDLLKSNEYEILLATDGEEAIEMTNRESPQVIFLDIKMPRIDGIEACRRIRADEKTRYIPIIMISAFEDMSLRAIAAGADDFLSKPFTREDVFIRVRSALRIRNLTNELERAVAYLEELHKSQPRA